MAFILTLVRENLARKSSPLTEPGRDRRGNLSCNPSLPAYQVHRICKETIPIRHPIVHFVESGAFHP